MVAAAIYGTRWEKIEKKKRTKQACSDSQYHTSFWFSTAASLVPVAAAFVWLLGSRREKEMKLKYASQVTCACPCGRRGPVGNRAPACQLMLARPIGFPSCASARPAKFSPQTPVSLRAAAYRFRGNLKGGTDLPSLLGGAVFLFFLFFIFIFYKNIFSISKFTRIYPGCPAAGRPRPGRPAAGRQGHFWKIFAEKIARRSLGAGRPALAARLQGGRP